MEGQADKIQFPYYNQDCMDEKLKLVAIKSFLYAGESS